MNVVPAEVPIDPPKIAIVGEAPGAQEEKEGRPFCGASGQELDRMLHEAGILRSEVLLTNVVNIRPDGNHFGNFTCKKAELPKATPRPFNIPLSSGRYLRPEYWDQLDRLRIELTELSHPNVVVALGNTALWATCHLVPHISHYRGTAIRSPWGFKVIPTFHPAKILREWANRTVVVMDLIKVRMNSTFPEIRRPKRHIYVPQTIPELEDLGERFLRVRKKSCDIENPWGFITCVGLAPSRDVSVVVPFYHPSTGNWWATEEEEVAAWEWLRRQLSDPTCTYVGQNFLYDMWHLWRRAKILPLGPLSDTMVRHHAMYPEFPKDLGFLGSLYTEEAAWKQERPRGTATAKKDE